ncbi:hypothetical protein DPMN_145332 [Dreissena polymorpha]|uniref:Uncharacterized protein n=1 Tax=Dreissena polymorpha TaxID=45954 RepID=A0A9D4J183_DREPO|nr:hypothetical protein DPMN_145332 [Dreissena polymorpha]
MTNARHGINVLKVVEEVNRVEHASHVHGQSKNDFVKTAKNFVTTVIHSTMADVNVRVGDRENVVKVSF